ncbi:hypothetical protein AF71_00043970 [Rhizobium sp. 57MFTsu3.2]|nr:hypothetical protein [Rhizobium sp. 57MFTsu3.2]
MRRKLAAFALAFVRQDADWLLEAAIDLGILGGDLDRSEFRRGLVEIIGDYAALPLKDWSLAEAFLRVTRLGQAQNVFVPLDLLILMRAMFLAEHTVRILDPNLFVWETVAVLSMGQSSEWTISTAQGEDRRPSAGHRATALTGILQNQSDTSYIELTSAYPPEVMSPPPLRERV